jgi:hypothetical protein
VEKRDNLDTVGKVLAGVTSYLVTAIEGIADDLKALHLIVNIHMDCPCR